MCEICGQVHQDMVQRDGHTVCASARGCLLHALREASEYTVRRMQHTALKRLESSLTSTDMALERTA